MAGKRSIATCRTLFQVAPPTERHFSTSSVLTKKQRTVKKNSPRRGGYKDLSYKGDRNEMYFKNPRPLDDVFPRFNSGSLTPESVGKSLLFSDQASKYFGATGIPDAIRRETRHALLQFSTIRDHTLRICGRLQNAEMDGSLKARLAIVGDSGVGKSILMLQAVDYAVLSGWIVIYIPDASNLTSSTTGYTYDSSRQEFMQDDASASILNLLQEKCSSELSKIQIQQGGSLLELIKQDSTKKPSILLEEVMDALSKQSSVPVLLAIDGCQTLFGDSDYRTPDHRMIRSYGLSVPRLILEYISGQRAFESGSVVVADEIRDGQREYPSYDIGIGRRQQRSYEDLEDYTYYDIAKCLETFVIDSKVDRAEAGGIAKSLYDAHLIRHLSDQSFVEMLVQSGGNLRQFMSGWRQSLS